MSRQGRTHDDNGNNGNTGNIVFFMRFGDTPHDKKRNYEALHFHQVRKARKATVRKALGRVSDERGVMRRSA